jgi:hypothetical protein
VTDAQYWQDRLPDIIFVGGKKRSGKDFLCDQLVAQGGFTKVHMVEPWLRQFFERRGLDPDRWEELKVEYRAEIQAEASTARAENPNVLIDYLRGHLASLPKPIAITAMRFINEATLGIEMGAMVVRVKTSDETRRQRFIASGDDLALMDDPFEAEVDVMPVHLEISGEMPAHIYVPALADYYRQVQLAYWRRSIVKEYNLAAD